MKYDGEGGALPAHHAGDAQVRQERRGPLLKARPELFHVPIDGSVVLEEHFDSRNCGRKRQRMTRCRSRPGAVATRIRMDECTIRSALPPSTASGKPLATAFPYT